MNDTSLHVVTTDNYRVAFPLRPDESQTRRGGLKLEAETEGCFARFVHEMFEDATAAAAELKYDYKKQFIEDEYEEFGEQPLKREGQAGRSIEAVREGQLTRIIEVVVDRELYRLMVDTAVDDTLGQTLVDAFEVRGAWDRPWSVPSKFAGPRANESSGATDESKLATRERSEPDFAWLDQLAAMYRSEAVLDKARALLTARWQFGKLTPELLQVVAERGRSEPREREEQKRNLYNQGMDAEDAARLVRSMGLLWVSLAYYLPHIAGLRGESRAAPDVQDLAFRVLAGRGTLAEVVARDPMHPLVQQFSPAVMSGEFAVMAAQEGPLLEQATLYSVWALDAAMLVGRDQIPVLIGLTPPEATPNALQTPPVPEARADIPARSPEVLFSDLSVVDMFAKTRGPAAFAAWASIVGVLRGGAVASEVATSIRRLQAYLSVFATVATPQEKVSDFLILASLMPDLALARTLSVALTEVDPSSPAAWIQRARAATKLGDDTDALAAVDRVQSLGNPDAASFMASAQRMRAEILERHGDTRGAREAVEAALAQKEIDADDETYLQNLRDKLNPASKFIQLFEQHLKDSASGYPRARQLAGLVFHGQTLSDEWAWEIAQYALAGSEANGAAWTDVILESLTVALPSSSSVWMAYGVRAMRQKHAEEAEALLTRAVDIDPNNYRAWRFRGELRLLQKRDVNKAKDDFDKALAIVRAKADPALAKEALDVVTDLVRQFRAGEA